MRKSIVILIISVIFLLICSSVCLADASTISPDQPGTYNIGSYKVWYFAFPYGIYQATIRYPSISNGQRTPVDFSGAPYPVIIIANGLAGSEQQITWIPEHLTSYGYVTLCFTPPHRFSFDATQWSYGFLGGFRELQKQNDHRFSPMYHLLDTKTCGAIGLSMGGGGVIEATGSINSVIDASVALAPAGFPSVFNAAQNIIVPIQLQVGTVDKLVPPNHVKKIYTQHITNDTNKEYLSINGGNHIGFIDEYYTRVAQQWGIDNSAGISIEQQHNISKKYFIAWFEYYLRNLDEYYTFIFGQEAQKDLDEGVLTDLQYNIT
ncbi:MAG: dienelactone hydrolase family protein [Candidatus Thermoplasmatota archaeon]|nr:dienelactone hydrolase family protein [Candidatus Thermoplasmatota archaeon]